MFIKYSLLLIVLYLTCVTVDGQNVRTKRQGVKGRPPPPPPTYDTQEDISDVGAPQRTRPSGARPAPRPQSPQEDEDYGNGADGEAVPEPPIYGGVMGVPGVDFPGYLQIPKTDFSCANVPFEPGMYADMDTQCQAYHLCFNGRKESFLCGIGTVFNQAILGCDYWHSVDCSLTPNFYNINEELGKAGAEPGPGGAPPSSVAQAVTPFRPAPAPGPIPTPRQPSVPSAPGVSRTQIPSQPVQTTDYEDDQDYQQPQIPQPAPTPRPAIIPQPPPPQRQPAFPRQPAIQRQPSFPKQPVTRPQPQPARFQPQTPATKARQPAIPQPQQPYRPAPVVPAAQRPQIQPSRKVPQPRPVAPRPQQPVQRLPPSPVTRPVPRPAPIPRPVPQPRPAPRPIAPRPAGKTSPARPFRPIPSPVEPQRPIVQTKDDEPVEDSQQSSFDY